MKLTDNYIKGVSAKESAYRIYEQGADKGFGLKVTPAGSISFFLQYSFSGKQRFYNLGRYPSVSLSDARIKCREVRAIIDSGIDPQEQSTPNRFGTVCDLFNYYIKKMQDDGKRTWAAVEKDLSANCGDIMDMQANRVEPSHIRDVLHRILLRGTPEKPKEVMVNRVRAYLHRAFKVGIYHDNDPTNPLGSVTFKLSYNPVEAIPKITRAEVVGDRNLSIDEIQILWTSTDIGEQMLIATKLLLIFGCRLMELCGAKKSEFDFDAMTWTMPWERIKTSGKNKRPHLLPITPMAKTLIERQWIYSMDSDYLFPGRINPNKPIRNTSLSHALRRVKGVDSFNVRALRRTWKTICAEIGIEKSIMDRIQNHALTDVSDKHYNKYHYLTEKRAALEQWERYLEDILGK
ncbi:MAG: integrase arm-type DNA-binding domain-containing protein [Methylobacter sp.]|jgi:integrase|nr:integrase arm-type DNA-binding domain-containing protein [Methylobacter sp.]